MAPLSTEEDRGLTATAAAHPNLALVKYWGRLDPVLNIPANGSISVNLSGAVTTTTVTFDAALASDDVWVDGAPADVGAYARVVAHLDLVRDLAKLASRASVVSHNDFPVAAGIASSAAAFAALSLAASRAAGLTLDARELSILARRGSGSACRSIPDGFVEWIRGQDHLSSYARSIVPIDYWDIRVVTVAWAHGPKAVSSLSGHDAAPSSPFYLARLLAVDRTLDEVRDAILGRDLNALGMAAEREAVSMHAVAMTSRVQAYPWMSGIYYLAPETLHLIQAIQEWRRSGLSVYFTLDAGPSAHLLCSAVDVDEVTEAVGTHTEGDEAKLIVSRPGRGAWLLDATDGASAPSVDPMSD